MGPGDVVMAEVWISDAEGRVLGPMPLEVVKQLAAGGHVHDIRRVSNDGKRWSTAHSFPELVPFLKSQATPADAQVSRLQSFARSCQSSAPSPSIRCSKSPWARPSRCIKLPSSRSSNAFIRRGSRLTPIRI